MAGTLAARVASSGATAGEKALARKHAESIGMA